MTRCLALLWTAAALTATEKTALDRYVAQPDPAYRYRLERTVRIKDATVYIINLTSQHYLTRREVNHPEWWHWLSIVKPGRVKHSTGLLYIDGGNNGEPPPRPHEEMVRIALTTHSVVAGVRMTPNQPLRFADEKTDRCEDGIIAYTWDKFLKTGDEKWPLPMTKSAVRAMDTVTNFLKSKRAAD